MAHVLSDAVRRHAAFRDVTDNDLNKEIMVWLRVAPDRRGKRKQRDARRREVGKNREKRQKETKTQMIYRIVVLEVKVLLLFARLFVQ